MILYLATTNFHKLKEINEFLSPSIICKNLSELPFYKPPEETGLSFKENAQIKSVTFFQELKKVKKISKNDLVLGEDSGLCVESLNNAPGIYSARYKHEKASDIENLNHLLDNMKEFKNRKAWYTCSICVSNSQGGLWFAEEKFFGSIATQPKGENGFGYDPVFIPEGSAKTLGELDFSFKQSSSHRAKALKKLKSYLLANCQ